MKKTVVLLIIITSIYILCAQVIDDQDFSWYSQGDARWKYNNLGYSNYNTIGRSGCVLTSLSMLFNSEASNPQVTPEELNAWLIKNNGYSNADMRWEVVANFDGENKGVELVGKTDRRNDWDFLSEQISKGNKVITKVGSSRSHWVVITAMSGDGRSASSYEVNDPGLPAYKKRYLSHWGGFKAARAFSGNWVTREQLVMDDNVKLLAADSLDTFMYNRYNVENPAELYISIDNSLNVPVTGYYSLGLYNSDNKYVTTIGFPMYLTLKNNEKKEILFPIDGIDKILNTNYQIKLMYAKSLDDEGKPQNALVLNPSGVNTYSFKLEVMDFVTDN